MLGITANKWVAILAISGGLRRLFNLLYRRQALHFLLAFVVCRRGDGGLLCDTVCAARGPR
jgi:hypothetical protein